MGPGVGTKASWGMCGELTGVTPASSLPMPSLATVQMLPVMPRRALLRSGVRARSGEIPGADGRDARCGEDEKVRRP